MRGGGLVQPGEQAVHHPQRALRGHRQIRPAGRRPHPPLRPGRRLQRRYGRGPHRHDPPARRPGSRPAPRPRRVHQPRGDRRHHEPLRTRRLERLRRRDAGVQRDRRELHPPHSPAAAPAPPTTAARSPDPPAPPGPAAPRPAAVPVRVAAFPGRRLSRRGGRSPLRLRRAWVAGCAAAPPDFVLRSGLSRGWMARLGGGRACSVRCARVEGSGAVSPAFSTPQGGDGPRRTESGGPVRQPNGPAQRHRPPRAPWRESRNLARAAQRRNGEKRARRRSRQRGKAARRSRSSAGTTAAGSGRPEPSSSGTATAYRSVRIRADGQDRPTCPYIRGHILFGG